MKGQSIQNVFWDQDPHAFMCDLQSREESKKQALAAKREKRKEKRKKKKEEQKRKQEEEEGQKTKEEFCEMLEQKEDSADGNVQQTEQNANHAYLFLLVQES